MSAKSSGAEGGGRWHAERGLGQGGVGRKQEDFMIDSRKKNICVVAILIKTDVEGLRGSAMQLRLPPHSLSSRITPKMDRIK